MTPKRVDNYAKRVHNNINRVDNDINRVDNDINRVDNNTKRVDNCTKLPKQQRKKLIYVAKKYFSKLSEELRKTEENESVIKTSKNDNDIKQMKIWLISMHNIRESDCTPK
jgi:hypothetical protein